MKTGPVGKPTFWPGTNIRKSYGNGFDLLACKGAIAATTAQSEQRAQAGLLGAIAQQAKTKRTASAEP